MSGAFSRGNGNLAGFESLDAGALAGSSLRYMSLSEHVPRGSAVALVFTNTGSVAGHLPWLPMQTGGARSYAPTSKRRRPSQAVLTMLLTVPVGPSVPVGIFAVSRP